MKRSGGDMLLLWGSLALAAEPVVADPAVDLPITLASGAIWAGLYLGEPRQSGAFDPAYRPPGGIDALAIDHHVERWDALSDVVLNGTIGLGLALTPLTGDRAHLDDRALLVIEAAMINGAATELIKYAVDRPRPYTATAPTGEPEDRLSFPSGHASWTATIGFSTARTLDLSKDLGPGARVAVYGAATLITAGTGVLRVAAGVHHPSDVLAGSLLGGSIGWLVPELHRSERVRLSALPTRGGSLLVLDATF